MAKILLLLSVLVLATYSFNIVTVDDSDKVQVQLYYESLCPYCQQFMAGSLTKAVNTKDFWKICDFNLIPYGNARRQKIGDRWNFTCQHGVRECQGNLIETCAIKLNPDTFYSQVLPFVLCLENSPSNWTVQGKSCASKYGLSWEGIQECTSSQQGNDWQAEFASQTENLVPAHQYVPWVTVNGAHTDSTESSVLSNMVRYVCSIYRGPEKIEACK